MFNFAWPWVALLLPLPWLVRRFFPVIQRVAGRHQSQLLHPNLSRLQAAYGEITIAQSPWKLALLSLLWVALVLTLMQPQWLEFHDKVEHQGRDLMLAIDTSRSMKALDFYVDNRPVTRMSVVKGIASQFIAGRANDRIGLIFFGSQAYLQSPLSTDIQSTQFLLDQAVPGIAGDSTAIGDAIGLATKKLRDRPEGTRVLILVTDGENTRGMPPLVAAQIARQFNIRIYVIGVGSKSEKVLFIEEGKQTWEKMAIDEPLLQQIATLTGGQYFQATNTRALEAIYQQIDQLEKTTVATLRIAKPTPLYRWPLAIALIALLLLGLHLRNTILPGSRHD